MENLLDIFDKLAFPVSVCVVLFAILMYFVKHALKMLAETLKANAAEQKEYVAYLKESNARLVSVVEDNTETIKKFSYVLEKYMQEKK